METINSIKATKENTQNEMFYLTNKYKKGNKNIYVFTNKDRSKHVTTQFAKDTEANVFFVEDSEYAKFNWQRKAIEEDILGEEKAEQNAMNRVVTKVLAIDKAYNEKLNKEGKWEAPKTPEVKPKATVVK